MTKPHHHRRASDEMGAKARRLYQAWRSDGLTPGEIKRLLIDLKCMADMEVDATPPAPCSAVGSAAVAVMEG